jgi:monoamine oxidase
MLALSAATLAAACATGAKGAPRKDESVAIVGGGAAGLTAAYRLAQAGRRPIVLEASGRLGGRMFTRRDFTPEGQFCELGGELVDTNHLPLRSLARELGVKIDPLLPEGESANDLYDVGGRLRGPRDMLDPERMTGAFLPAARVIAKDKAALMNGEEWTARARELDAMSLADYLRQLRRTTEGWAIDVLDLAYVGELGLATKEQSALNLVDFIGTETDKPFAIYGESDESARIDGGSSTLIEALTAAIGDRAEIVRHRTLVGIARDDERIRLDFDAPEGAVAASYDRVVLALPFTRLRQVKGIDALGLPAQKLAAIRELGYGTNAKLMVATRSRPWRDPKSGAPQFTGAVYSDRGFQSLWETSRGQPGTGGVLTNFLGAEAGTGDEASALKAFATGLKALSPLLASSLNTDVHASFFWARYPHTLGSYSAARPKQYTTLLEVTATAELEGRLHFAGEHTSAESMGYMNGAVESGDRVAKEVLGA